MKKNNKKNENVIKVNRNIPKISIIVPIYNVEKYLRECLDSIIAQTLREIEIICVNDGSTDHSLEILKEYQEKDDRIILITGPNGGYGHAINRGLSAAKGEFIGIVESDDYILPDMYECLYSTVEMFPELEMVKSDAIRFINGGEEEDCKYINVCKNELYDRVITLSDEPDCYNAYMINTTGIYKRSVIEKNGIKLNESKGAAYQDNGFWFQIFSCSKNIMFIHKAFYMYRMDRNESSTNCTTFENALCIFGEWRYILNVLKKFGRKHVEEYKAMYSLRCYGSFYYHFTRVLEEYKLLFLIKFSEEMQSLSDEGILCTDLFPAYQCNDLLQIMENPKLFYYKWCRDNFKDFFGNQLNAYITTINKRIEDMNLATSVNDMEDITISVVVPAYNVEKTIQRCIKSIVSQTLDNIEIICVDDGSSDRTLAILLTLKKQYKNIVVMTQVNAGAGPARNAALNVARGEFVCFMDPDDTYVDNTCLECLYQTAIEKKVDVCGGNNLTVENGIVKNNMNVYFEEDGYVDYSDWQGAYGFQQFIFRRSLLRDNGIEFPAYRRFQDPPFFVRALVRAGRMYVVNKDIYKYYFDKNHVKWDEEKICHLICGIIDLIKISKEHQFQKLHYESVRLVQQSFAERIMTYSNNSYKVIRLLCVAESEIDTDLYNVLAEKKQEAVTLNIIDKQLNRFNQATLPGYIGPNAFKEYIRLLNECSDLKNEILEIQTAISYRLGVLLTGGKNKAYKNGILIRTHDLKQLGKKANLDCLSRDKIRLEQIVITMKTSKALKIGLKLTSFFRRRKNV